MVRAAVWDPAARSHKGERGAEYVTPRLTDRINAALERRLPEQRLFLKSEDGTRYVRLRPVTQATMVIGSSLLVCWTVIVTSFFLIDTISAGNSREQSVRQHLEYQTRLNALSDERDARATEARQAQERFSLAMDQVSDMQTRLLDSEERRRELETAVDVIQTTLRRTMGERDTARELTASLQGELQSETGTVQTAASRQEELERTLGFMTSALHNTSEQRDGAAVMVADAAGELARMQFEASLTAERSERIFAQIEDAVSLSMEPLDELLRTVGVPTESLINQVRAGYSGQGGPLMPISVSTSGEAPDALSLRANEVLASLDALNLRRIAAEQLPFSIPVAGSFRYTSGFGYRRDPFNGGSRMHSGTDFAGSSGTPIVATADGVVTVAGRQSGYGLMVEIRHPFGMETRYAHMSRLRVTEGQRVSRGDRIGDMGSTGRSTGTHLHYEVHQNGRPINPMNFITAGRNVF
jgi:murein DD-endopeptidase MepM/ murein hydrolase activator NlpD